MQQNIEGPVEWNLRKEADPKTESFINEISHQNELKSHDKKESQENQRKIGRRRSTIKQKKVLPPLVSQRKYAGDLLSKDANIENEDPNEISQQASEENRRYSLDPQMTKKLEFGSSNIF